MRSGGITGRYNRPKPGDISGVWLQDDQYQAAVDSNWSKLGTLEFPAENGIQLYDAGFRKSGLYHMNTSSGIKQVYVDLQTRDGEYGKAGWMLVGSWSTASEWTKSATTSTAVFDGVTPMNCFSANFGTKTITQMRVHVSDSISSIGENATSADFYYWWSSGTVWREAWVVSSANDIRTSTAVNGGAGVAREALKPFTYARNLKFPYVAYTQNWANFSDGGGRQGDWWNGLTGTQTAIGWYGAGDGSLAILPYKDQSTGAGHDCNVNQAKVGWDDTVVAAWFGTTETANMNANTGTQGSNTKLWLWIK